MKLIINGTTYDGDASPFMGDLRLLKPACGFGYGTVLKHLESIRDSEDKTAWLNDEDTIAAVIAWIWLVRLRAGERDLTFAEVGELDLAAVQFIGDEPAEEPAPVVAAKKAAKPRKATARG